MKVYLAAKFERKTEMREVRDFLVNDGHKVVSRWIDVEHEEDASHTVTDELRVSYAQMDVDDVLHSEVLVMFSHPRSETHNGGGRHVEFGIALQSGRKIIVVGPKGEHIFHYWPGIMFAADLDELASTLWSMEPE